MRLRPARRADLSSAVDGGGQWQSAETADTSAEAHANVSRRYPDGFSLPSNVSEVLLTAPRRSTCNCKLCMTSETLLFGVQKLDADRGSTFGSDAILMTDQLAESVFVESI